MVVGIETVVKFSPVFMFHEQEKFFPCSIEHILHKSKLYVRKPKSKKLKKIKNPTQTDLNEHFQSENYIDIAESQYTGMPIGEAPIYYTIQKFASFVEINYLLLYAFKGSQPFLKESTSEENLLFIGNNYGQQQGGIKRTTVRIVLIDDMRNDYKIFQVGFEKDGLMYFDTSDNVTMIGDDENSSPHTHPVVHVGLYGHNFWNKTVREPVILRDGGSKVSAVSCIADQGNIWRPYNCDAGIFKRVGFKKVREGYIPIEPEIWVNYQGRIGRDLYNEWTDSPTSISGNPLTDKQVEDLSFMHDPDTAFDSFVTRMKIELSNGRAPSALGNRFFVYPDRDASDDRIS